MSDFNKRIEQVLMHCKEITKLLDTIMNRLETTKTIIKQEEK